MTTYRVFHVYECNQNGGEGVEGVGDKVYREKRRRKRKGKCNEVKKLDGSEKWKDQLKGAQMRKEESSMLRKKS